MAKTVKVLTVCGTGGVTSSVIGAKVKEILKAAGYESEVTTCKVIEVGTHLQLFRPDLVVASTPVPNCPVPVISGMPFLTGVGVDRARDEILKALGDQT